MRLNNLSQLHPEQHVMSRLVILQQSGSSHLRQGNRMTGWILDNGFNNFFRMQWNAYASCSLSARIDSMCTRPISLKLGSEIRKSGNQLQQCVCRNFQFLWYKAYLLIFASTPHKVLASFNLGERDAVHMTARWVPRILPWPCTICWAHWIMSNPLSRWHYHDRTVWL